MPLPCSSWRAQWPTFPPSWRNQRGSGPFAKSRWHRIRPPVATELLGLEFEVEQIPTYRAHPGRIDLRIRPLRAGKSGKWIRTGIGWDDLDYASRSYLPAHVDLLLQFRAAAGASARYMFPRTPWLSISSVTSVWWSLLEQAVESGLTLLVAGTESGPELSETKASVVLNVRRSDEGLARCVTRGASGRS